MITKIAFASILALLISLLISGCTPEPKWKQVYKQCQEKMELSIGTEIDKMDHSSGKNEMAKSAAHALGALAQGMGSAVCETIKKVCEPAPDSTACTAIVNNAQF